MLNLNLRMRKQQKNLNFGIFCNKMVCSLQKCQYYDKQNIMGDCIRLKETKAISKLNATFDSSLDRRTSIGNEESQ